MWSLIKKENGTLEHTKRNTISFPNSKKKCLKKFNKCPVHQYHPLLKIQVVKELRRTHGVFKISMITQSHYHNESLKISMRKQDKQITSHYFVSLQIVNP